MKPASNEKNKIFQSSSRLCSKEMHDLIERLNKNRRIIIDRDIVTRVLAINELINEATDKGSSKAMFIYSDLEVKIKKIKRKKLSHDFTIIDDHLS